MFFLLRTLFSGKLAVVQSGVPAALFQQFAVRALFDDVALFHKEDAVRVADGRKAVRDDEARSAAHQLLHRLADLRLRARIDGGRRLVKDKNRGLHKNTRAMIRSCRCPTEIFPASPASTVS